MLAALPATSQAQPADTERDLASGDSAAMIRLGPFVRPANLSLPQPLEPADAAAYREAFAAASRGDARALGRALDRASDGRLAADARAEYLVSPEAKPRLAEFTAWLRDNPEHRDAPSIRAAAAALHPDAKLAKPAGQPARAIAPGAAINDLGPGKEA
ncbi:MAG: hypothetical protein ACKOUS_10450, partial [Alphaproteobacteria bacterium]